MVIGESGVGKSTFLNFISGLDESHPCNFKAGESDPTQGLTTQTVAKKVKWKGNGREFIAVDTPGLDDPLGEETDGKRIRNIIEFLQNGLDGRKITTFLYIHKGTKTRYNFHYLRMFHYMFGDRFWDHLCIEVTWWKHTRPAYKERAKGKRVGFENETNAAEKLNKYIQETTNAPNNFEIPIVFIDPMFDLENFEYLPKNLSDIIMAPQNMGEEKLHDRLFHSNLGGFKCLNCNADFIPHGRGKSTRPIITLKQTSIQVIRSTSLKLTCLVPILFVTSNCSTTCKSGWTFNNGSSVKDLDGNLATTKSGFMERNELRMSRLQKEDIGKYRCIARHCRSNHCKETLSEIPISVEVIESPPMIMVEDSKGLSFKCKQETMNGFNGTIPMVIKRVNENKTYLLNQLDFENFMTSIDDQNNQISEFRNRRLQIQDMTEENLIGQYFCSSQTGEPDLYTTHNDGRTVNIWKPMVTLSNITIDGGWSQWSRYGMCTTGTNYCGEHGHRIRTRQCDSPKRFYNGLDCDGKSQESIPCNGFICPAKGVNQVLSACSSENAPRLKEGTIDEILLPFQNIDNAFTKSWIGSQDCSSKEMVIIKEIVDLNSLVYEALMKCNQDVFNGTSLKIVAYSVVISKDITITGLKKLDVFSKFLMVKRNAATITFDQNDAANGNDGRGQSGSNGFNGVNGIDGTVIQIITDELMTESPVRLIVSGGKGGKGGKGSNGQNGKDGQKREDRNSFGFTNHKSSTFTQRTHYLLSYSCKPAEPALGGSNGRNGNDGKNGGDGGNGGNSGSIKIIAQRISGEVLIVHIPGENGVGGEKGIGGAGGIGGWSSVGIMVEEEMKEGSFGEDYLYLCKYKAYRIFFKHGEPGKSGNPGNNGFSGNLLPILDSCPTSLERSKRSPSSLDKVVIDKVMEPRSVYIVTSKNELTNEFSRDDETNIGSHASLKMFEGKMKWLREKVRTVRSDYDLSKISDMFSDYHTTVIAYKEQLLENEIQTEEAEQNRLIDGMNLLKGKKEDIIDNFRYLIQMAFNVKENQLKNHIEQMEAAAQMEFWFGLFNGLSTIGFGMAQSVRSYADTARKNNFARQQLGFRGGKGQLQSSDPVSDVHLQTNIMHAKTDAVISTLNTIVGTSTLRLPGLIKNGKIVASEANALGCPVNDIIRNISTLAEQNDYMSDFQLLKNYMYNASSLAEVMQYDSLKRQNEFRSTMHCVVTQNLEFQNEPTVEAQRVLNAIDEYFEVDKGIIKLQEKWFNIERKLESLKTQKSLLNHDWTPLAGELSMKENVIIEYYQGLERTTLRDLASYVFFLEIKYAKRFTSFDDLMDHQMNTPLQIPFHQNIDHLHKIWNQILEWKNKQFYNPSFDITNPWHQILHLKFSEKSILKTLSQTFSVTLDVPNEEYRLKGEIIGPNHLHHISNTINTKLSSVFVRLDFASHTYLMPQEMYVRIDQSSRFESTIDEQIRVAYSPKTLMKYSNFKTMSMETDDEIVEKLQTDDCCLREIGCEFAQPFCSSPFSSYKLVINQGNQTECPSLELHENCIGLSLEGLKAIHLYLKYYVSLDRD